MRKNYSVCLSGLSLLSASAAMAQLSLSLIRATSTHAAVSCGGILNKNAWTLSPKSRPDVYRAERARQPKWVTFCTDPDSIRTLVKPSSCLDFVILLNNRGSCYTPALIAIGPKSMTSRRTVPPDTIPFTLTAHDGATAVRAIVSNTDTLPPQGRNESKT